MAAYTIDQTIVSLLVGGLWFGKSMLESVSPSLFIFKNVLFMFDIFDILLYLITVFYFVLFTTFAGTTPGKRLLNLAVVDEAGNKVTFMKALYRETIARYLSSFFYFGYIMIFIDKRNRSFHDYLCDTNVIYIVRIRTVVKEKKLDKPLSASIPGNRVPVGNQNRPMGYEIPQAQMNRPEGYVAPQAQMSRPEGYVAPQAQMNQAMSYEAPQAQMNQAMNYEAPQAQMNQQAGYDNSQDSPMVPLGEKVISLQPEVIPMETITSDATSSGVTLPESTQTVVEEVGGLQNPEPIVRETVYNETVESTER